MPKVSVIIPCHNAKRFLAQTVESVLAQTISDFEIICVDNNSSDGTDALLDSLARCDRRVRVVSEPVSGEGPARDAGLQNARGTWLYFLDADDLMEPTLLEEALRRGESSEADLVIFRTSYLDDQTGEVRECPECFTTDWISSWEDDGVFSPQRNPKRIFTSFQNWVHNKLFRASFVREQGLFFQHLHRMADILFTCRALSEAKRIALLDRRLHLYRTNNPQSALVTGDQYPLDFYEAFLALRGRLEELETWELYHDSFVDWAEEAVAMNLYRARSFEGFSTIAYTMKNGGLKRLDIADYPAERALFPLRHECCRAILEKPLDELAFLYLSLEKRRIAEVETETSRLRVSLRSCRDSTSFRLGNALITPLARARDALRDIARR